MTTARQWTSIAAFYALLGVTLLIYWPGLDGPLVLDDIPNLKRLVKYGPVDDSSSFLSFIFSGSSAYPNRPLSFASFLVNDRGWPLYVPAHKYTNVLIHLVNSALVFWLALLLCRLTGLAPGKAACVALTAAALWVLAPLQVSTVLYVVQRMTELSAMFVLGGLIAYCHARPRLNERPAAALFLMTVGIAVFGVLGFLSKESAVLLTLYVLAVEHALLRTRLPVHGRRTRLCFAAWQWIVLVLPIVLLFIALIARGAFPAYEQRPFSAFERIASQPRILLDYLYNLLVPARQGMGVIHDDYILSTGLLTPPATLIAILLLLAAVIAAVYVSRRTVSLFGFAVLWFLSGHVLESSIISLEPYFEHRNYLPAFGPLFALSYFVWTTRLALGRYLKIGLGLYLAAFVFVTKQNVDVWSSRILLAETWASDHPRSVRAQQIRADAWSRYGDREKAKEILESTADLQPSPMSSQLQILLSACRADPDNVDEYLQKARARVENAYFDHAAIPTLIVLKDSHQQRCPDLSGRELLALIDVVLENDSVYIRKRAVADLLYVKATILAGLKEHQNAVTHLHAAFRHNPTHDIGLVSAEFLYNLGEYREALKVLDEISTIELKPWSPENFRDDEIRRKRDQIREKLDQAR